MVKKASSEIGETGWYSFSNRKGFMTAIEKKSTLKNWKYDFLFMHRTTSWANLPNWNDGKMVRNLFREPTSEEREAAHYFQY